MSAGAFRPLNWPPLPNKSSLLSLLHPVIAAVAACGNTHEGSQRFTPTLWWIIKLVRNGVTHVNDHLKALQETTLPLPPELQELASCSNPRENMAM
jgi:hypothetical protein